MHGDADVIPHRLAQEVKARPDPGKVFLRQMAGNKVVAGFARLGVILLGIVIRVHLDSGDAEKVALEHGRKLAAGGRIEPILGVSRPIGPHSVTILATQQLAHGHAEQLSRQVPESNLHAAGRGHRYSSLGAGPAGPTKHFGEERFDIEGILTHHDIAQISLDHILNAITPVSFTDSGNTGVSIDSHQGGLGMCLDEHGFHVRNLDLLKQGRSHGPIAGENRRGRNHGGQPFQEIPSRCLLHYDFILRF